MSTRISKRVRDRIACANVYNHPADRLRIGDRIALKQDKPAWYSEYGLNSKMIISAGEIGIVTAVDVPVVRKLEKRNSYHVAVFGQKQVDFNTGEYVRLS